MKNITPRPYQQDAANAVISAIKRTTTPVVARLGTGAGKSIIISLIASEIIKLSGKQVLCLAPSKELVEQNAEKYVKGYHLPASIFSASVGIKTFSQPIIFGSPLTVVNALDKFSNVAGIIIDECHGVTPTIIKIIDGIRAFNPNLRVIGLSATPFRRAHGYIYDHGLDGKPEPNRGDGNLFDRIVYSLTEEELIDMGFLTPPRLYSEAIDGYDVSGIKIKSNGLIDEKSNIAAFEHKERLTRRIIEQVLSIGDRRSVSLIYAATVEHANEIMGYINRPYQSRIITGKTPKAVREESITQARVGLVKYLVSVGTLTTGVDIPRADTIAILRYTESAALYGQIIGRGTRLNEGKDDFLILDYAGNVERHASTDRPFNIQVISKVKTERDKIPVICPDCGKEHQFSVKDNEEGFEVDKYGYFVTSSGLRIAVAHFGQSCECGYKWLDKECPSCGNSVSLSARICPHCHAEIVDPNAKLDHQASTDGTLTANVLRYYTTITTKGNTAVHLHLDSGKEITVYYSPNGQDWQRIVHRRAMVSLSTLPCQITYKRKDKFWDVKFKTSGSSQKASNSSK